MRNGLEPRGQAPAPAARNGRRTAERRKRLWFNLASWATTLLIVAGVGAIVHWRVTSVLSDDHRSRQAQAELDRVLSSPCGAPQELERAAAGLRAILADYPGTEAARKAQAELGRIGRLQAARKGARDAEEFGLDKP